MKAHIVTVFGLLLALASCSDQRASDNVGPVETTPVEETAIATPEKREIQDKVLDQNEMFDQFKNDFLEKRWELYPSQAVYVGYYKHDRELLVPNGALRAKRRAFLVNELQALKQFDANQLTTSNATDLALIEGEIRSSLWYLDSFRSFEWNPAQYNPASIFGLILNTDYKPLAERVLTISERLVHVPKYYATAIENLKNPTLPHLGLAIQQTEGALKLYQSMIPEKAKEATLDEAQSALLNSRLADAVSAVQGYLSWLQTKQNELEESGEARSFRIGAEMFDKKFKHDIASDYTSAELYQLALERKAALHQDMIAITEELWDTYFPDQTIPEERLTAVRQLIDHLSARHVERENFVEEIKRQIPLLEAFVNEKDLLDSDPSRPLVVREMPAYQRGFAGASVDAPGPYDATANTYYNVSPLDSFTDEQAESYLREYNYWILQILNIHEAIPGHYTQLMHANKSPSKIKAIFGNGAMIEGWAVYSQLIMLEAGWGNNEPEMWLMYGKWSLREAVNAILDYSIHVLDMDQDTAMNLLMNEAFQERTEAEGKWRRATVSQVQLSSYFTGYSEIYEFREQLKKRLGDAFDLKAFHNEFLSYGNAPVPIIKRLMLERLRVREATELPTKEADEETSDELPIEADPATEGSGDSLDQA